MLYSVLLNDTYDGKNIDQGDQECWGGVEIAVAIRVIRK